MAVAASPTLTLTTNTQWVLKKRQKMATRVTRNFKNFSNYSFICIPFGGLFLNLGPVWPAEVYAANT